MNRQRQSSIWRLHCDAKHERWLRDTVSLLEDLGIRWARGETIRGRATFGGGSLPVIEVDGEYFVNPNRCAIERLAESGKRSPHAA